MREIHREKRFASRPRRVVDGVESELVVRSAHSTQATPATIEEVRRILYLHLQEP